MNSPANHAAKPHDNPLPASHQALDWLIVLQEDPDNADTQARFTAWLQRDEAHQLAWDEAKQVWGLLGETRHAAANAPPPGQRAPLTPRRRGRRRVTLPLSLAAAVFLGVLLQPAFSLWLAADYTTGIAENRKISLADGSVVWLGADSAISIAYEPARRRIRLLSGEAYFSVRPDPTRPFRVETGRLDTTVLGTAFNVNVADDSVTVAVNHGRVAAATPDKQQQIGAPLQAGDWLRVAENGRVERGNDQPAQIGDWRGGKLIVKDRPVAEVIDDIRRYYRGVIMLTDSTLASRRVTGMYDLHTPENTLRAIAQVHGAQLRRISPWLIIISTR